MGHIRNPVARGHAPDPSVVRVGRDFFLANSSFGLLPGIPIRHSTDLVHWTLIGHAVSRPAQYRRDGKAGPVELFAPTLRHHDARFYLACTNAHAGQGNFYVTTDDPAGEWSDAIWVDDVAFDPSLFRDDDGTWYYTRRSLEFGRDDGLGPIVQAEIDIETGSIGPVRPLTPAGGGFVTNDIEGPHLFTRDGRYYLTAAEGSSSGKGHMQTTARSRSPWGPFEPAPHNPILTHRDRVGHPIQNLGHADLFDDADGNWWAVALGTRHAPLSQHHNIGRETFLLPVQWTEDGWPVVGRNGTAELMIDDVPLPTIGPPIVPRDTLWTRGWVAIGQPLDGSALVDGGTVRVPAADAPWERSQRRSALLLAQSADDQLFRATIGAGDAMDAAADAAGVAVYTDRRHVYAATVAGRGPNRIVTLRLQVDDLVLEQVHAFPGGADVELEIEARPDAYAFRASSDGHRLEIGRGSARLLSAEAVEWFVAAHFALVALGTNGYVDFRDVSVTDLEPRPSRPVPPFAADL